MSPSPEQMASDRKLPMAAKAVAATAMAATAATAPNAATPGGSHGTSSAAQSAAAFRRFRGARRILLLDVDNQRRWIGSRVGPEVHIPPVALMTLGAVLRRDVPGVEVRVGQSSLHARNDAELDALVADFRPDVIGLRAISFFYEELLGVARRLRATAPETPVIVGGPIVSSWGRAVLDRCEDLDFAVRGEGEFVLPELIAGEPPERVRGLLWRDGPDVREAAPRPLIEDLDALPFADYSLIDVSEYERHLSYAYNHRRQGVLYTSRGCIFRCSFCFQPSGVGARYRSAPNVVAEIRDLHDRHGVRDLYVIDDIFNVKRRRTLEVFRGIREAGLDVRLYFVNGLRADLMDPEMIEAAVAAGTVWITYAIETVVPETQKLIRKEMDMERAERSIRATQDAGIVVNVNTMYGFPGETKAMADRTLAWMGTLQRPSLLPYHFALKGYEGCEIVDQAKDAGWDVTAFLAEATTAYNHVPHGTPTFPRADMLAHYIDFHRRFALGNAHWVDEAVRTLRHVGYTDRDLVDMYTVLMNRPIAGVADIAPLPGHATAAATPSA